MEQEKLTTEQKKLTVQQKITVFSQNAHNLLTFALIAAIIFGAMQIFAFTWVQMGWPTETIIIDGSSLELPYLLNIGDTNMFAPAVTHLGFGLAYITQTLALMVALFFAKGAFKALKDSNTPFTAEVANKFKLFAIVFVAFSLGSGMAAIALAFVVLAICLVFEYGVSLQNEGDAAP